MYYDLIVWDDEDDPDGNHRRIVATGLVTTREVEDVIAGHQGPCRASRSSGLAFITGTASTGATAGRGVHDHPRSGLRAGLSRHRLPC